MAGAGKSSSRCTRKPEPEPAPRSTRTCLLVKITLVSTSPPGSIHRLALDEGQRYAGFEEPIRATHHSDIASQFMAEEKMLHGVLKHATARAARKTVAAILARP